MSPILKRGDIVIIQRAELLPAYFQEKLTVNDLNDDNSIKIDEQNDREKAIRIDELSGKASIDSLTLWRTPPLVMPGDIVAFKNPKETNTVAFSRILGLGSQRIRPKSSLHKIERVNQYSLWVESDSETDGFNGPISKKLLLGKVVKIIWPLSRKGDVPKLRPPLGRAWWP
jgi:signal peptidase I